MDGWMNVSIEDETVIKRTVGERWKGLRDGRSGRKCVECVCLKETFSELT